MPVSAPTVTPQLRTFDVEFYNPGSEEVVEHAVQAAYFQAENGMVVFKGQSHEIVFAVNAGHFVWAGRRDPSPIVNAIAEFAKTLRDNAEAKRAAD